MKHAIFFWNARLDGGVHLGLAANEDVLFDDLREGSGEPDPALIWYVDIFCESRSMPKSPSEIRNWFLQLSPHINRCFDALVKKLEIGVDGGLYPFSQRAKVKGLPAVISIEIEGSAMQKIRASDIASYLESVRKTWETELRQLPEAEPVPI